MRSQVALPQRLLFGVLLLLTLVFLVIAPRPALADITQQCSAPQQSCGCASCGCGGDYGIPHCPSGYSPYDDYCLPDCPSGFIRYPGMPGLCMPPCHHGCGEGYDQVPLPQCPQGYIRDLRDPDRCIADVDLSQHQDACPNGMTFSYDTGRCEVDCPAGMYRDARGLCESYFAQECPKDFTRDPATGKCLPPGIWPPDYTWVCLPTCPPGTYRDIRHPTLCVPPPSNCPDGFENVRGRCLPICDKGLQRDSYGYCVPPTCPDGSYANLRGQCQVPDCPQGMRRNDDGRCVPPPQTCNQGEERYNGQCVPICRDGTSRGDNGRCVPDQPNCPQGQRLNPDSNQCERIPPNIPNCNQRQVYSSSLKKCVDLPPPVHCGPDQHKDKNGRCVSNPAPEQPDCPPGLKPDGNGGCMRAFVPRNCPQGMIFNRRTNSCMRLRAVPDYPDDGGDGPPDYANPNVFKPYLPRARSVPDMNIQSGCPDGMYRDNNGRCVGKY